MADVDVPAYLIERHFALAIRKRPDTGSGRVLI